jgi:hypothetical protein
VLNDLFAASCETLTVPALSFAHQLKGKFAFLQLEIQFSLGRLQESSRSMDALFKTVSEAF